MGRRSDPFEGRCRISAYSSLKKRMRAVRHGKPINVDTTAGNMVAQARARESARRVRRVTA